MSTIYQDCKSLLKEVAKQAKKEFRNDKPGIRQAINDYTDNLCRNEIERAKLRQEISEAKATQYMNWLSDYACTLHPKK